MNTNVSKAYPSESDSSRQFWKSDLLLIERAAYLLEREAESWWEGFVEEGPGGKPIWPKGSELAQVRHHELKRTAERLCEMKKRLSKKAKLAAVSPVSVSSSTQGE